MFDMASAFGLPQMDLLDIGGGFTNTAPESSGLNFTSVAPQLRRAIDE